MNKKLLLVGLCISFAISPALVTEASDNAQVSAVSTEAPENMPVEDLPEDAINRIFVVKEIDEEATSAVLYEEGNENIEYVLDLGQFRDDNVKVNNRYKIYCNGFTFTSFPAKFGHIYRVEKLDPVDTEEEFENMPIDDLPQGYHMKTFAVVEISKDGEKPMATIEDTSNTGNKYVLEYKRLMDKYASVGDEYKIYWDGISLKSYPAQFGKIYRVEKVMHQHYDQTKELAISMFDSLIYTKAVSMLLDKSPETVSGIKDELTEAMGKVNTLVDQAFSKLLTEEERGENRQANAILKMIRYKYDKKLETASDKELARSLFDNMISSSAGKMLLEKTPETVKGIEKDLRASVEESHEIVDRAIKTLK